MDGSSSSPPPLLHKILKKRFPKQNQRKRIFANEQIWTPSGKVRLTDEKGEQLGIFSLQDALQKAKESGLDLIKITEKVDPPVCRIMDYSKYKYEQEKKHKLAKKKQHITHVKEIRFKPKIEAHDYQVKLKHIKEFLEIKDRVRVSLRFRGRENAHKEIGMELLNRIAKDVSGLGEMESPPQAMGRTMTMTLLPKTEK